MKKSIYLLLLLITIVSFSACSNSLNKKNAITMEQTVLSNVSEIENIDSVDDETIKAISVVVRTNVYKNNSGTISNNENIINSKSEVGDSANRIKNLISQTSGEILKENDDVVPNIYYVKSQENIKWTKKIKKSELLELLNKKNQLVSNITNIDSNYSDNGKLESLNIAGKKILLADLKNNFNLNSDYIYKIESDKSEITFFGKIDNKNLFNIEEFNNLDKSNKNYKELLSDYFNNLKVEKIS